MMINFRYHIVSLTAVFFALAIGLVVGTAALNGPAADSLRDQVNALGEQNQALRDQVNHLTDDVNAREQFAAQLAPMVLANRLSGTTVLLVSSGSGRDQAAGVAAMLTVAGAAINGRIEITDKFTDPAYGDELGDLARASPPPGLGATPAPSGDGVQSSSALLATVLHKRVPEVGEGDRRKVLLAYSSRGYLLGAGDLTSPADVVVFLAGPPAGGSDASRRNAALMTLVTELDRTGHVLVVASTDTGEGNLVARTRADPVMSRNISTVDNVATPQGRFVTAWAVADEIAGRIGHYGVGSGAALLPKPPP